MSVVARLQPWLVSLAAAALVVVVLGPGVRGWAAAALALAGTAGGRLLLPGPRAVRAEPVLRVVGRVAVGGRAEVVLVETGGRRYLVAQGSSITPLPLEERP